jgi:MraZ protein
MELIGGFGLASVDAKGRVALPVEFRAPIQGNAGARQFFIDTHPADPCLVGYERTWRDEYHARLDERERTLTEAGEEIAYNVKRRFMGGTLITFDDAGRFFIPEYHVMRAGIEDAAFFHGWGRSFEIWNPETLLATDGADEEMRAKCAFLTKKRKGA